MYKQYAFIGALTVLVVVLIALSFQVSGNPVNQKATAQDLQTVSRVIQFNSFIDDYYRDNGVLPAALTELDQANIIAALRKDHGVTYQIVSENSYTLCSTFKTDTTKETESSPYDYMGVNSEFKHPAGEYCFDFTAQAPPAPRMSPSTTQTTPMTTQVAPVQPIVLASPSPTIAPLNSATFFDHECPGELKNGVCTLPKCSYTYPLDLYKAGEAMESGVEFNDTCSGTQVFKHACHSPDGGKTFGHTVQNFKCPNGCANGACLK